MAKTETAWLVEWPASDNLPARWWNPVPNMGWMIDANKAIRFSRKEDAESYISGMRFGGGKLATEHKWIVP